MGGGERVREIATDGDEREERDEEEEVDGLVR
jgi:hypothetical protein